MKLAMHPLLRVQLGPVRKSGSTYKKVRCCVSQFI